MVPAIHSSQYLLSPLYHLLLNNHTRRMRLTALTKSTLSDWLQLLATLCHHAVPIASLVPQPPHVYAATDASKDGMGGYWLTTTLEADNAPTAWRYQWPDTLPPCLISADNPTGDLSINDLELVAFMAHHHIQSCCMAPSPYRHTCIATDNSATQAWINNGSPSTIAAPEFLLRLLAHNCRDQNLTIQAVHTSGATNTIADLLSHSFDLSDEQLLLCLNSLAPSKRPWRLVTPLAPFICNMNLALSKKLPQRVLPPPQE